MKNKNIDKVKIAGMALCSYTICCVLAVIALKSALELVLILPTNTWIAIKKIFLNMIMSIKQQIIDINEKYQRN